MTPLPPAFLGAPIAHRGLHDRAAGRVENSRAAVAAAVAAGYGVEIDLQLSADGEAMVFHDAALDRLTPETGPVRARTAAELARIPLTGGGETIPTLAEILALARTPLLVEIKDQGGRFDATGVGPLEARAAALLAAHAGPVAAMSFNPAAVAAVGAAAPGLPLGLVAGHAAEFEGAPRAEALARLAEFETSGAAFVSYHWRSLPTPETAALRGRGVPVLSWTIRSEAEESAARAHSDNITFEGYPARLAS
jgi:glycerophosphoryl diester phosphodiesterase